MTAHRIPPLTASHISALLRGRGDAALAQHADGSLDVIPSLAAEPLPPTSKPLCLQARFWADALVTEARKAAEAAGKPVKVNTQHKRAADLGTAELRHLADEAAARAAADAAPERPVPPSPARPRLLGRHAAHPTAATLAREEELYAALVVDVLDAADAA